MDNGLVIGAFIKTTDARDQVGLRRIISVCGSGLMVDHFRWKMVKVTNEDGSVKKQFFAERRPYSSVVSVQKVIRVYTLDHNLKHISERKVDHGTAAA